jgi:glucose/arabinose dehydrogenase
MAFIRGDRYGAASRGHLIVGSLRGNRLHRLVWEGQRLLREELIEAPIGQRVRDVRQGPDGWLYLLTDSAQGKLLRLLPAP